MKLIGELYRPDLAMIPIGGSTRWDRARPPWPASARRTGSGADHYGTFPVLAGTPAELRELTRDIPGLTVTALEPGGSI